MIKSGHNLFIQPGSAKILTILSLIFVLSVPVPSFHIYAYENDSAKNPDLSIIVEPEKAHVGDIIALSLKYQLPEGAVMTEEPKIGGIDDLNTLNIEALPGRVKLKILIDQLEPFKSEKITLDYVDKEGEEKTLESGPFTFLILSNLGERPAEEQLRPIRDIIPIKSAIGRYLPWAGGILLAVILIIGLYWWNKKRKKYIENASIIDPPHILARSEIDALEKQGLFEKGAIKPFYFRFSEILKQYIESIRHFPAAEYTTEEISRYLTSETDRRILLLLRQADLVKFADSMPSSSRKQEDISVALAYISETAPEDEETYLVSTKKREAALK